MTLFPVASCDALINAFRAGGGVPTVRQVFNSIDDIFQYHLPVEDPDVLVYLRNRLWHLVKDMGDRIDREEYLEIWRRERYDWSFWMCKAMRASCVPALPVPVFTASSGVISSFHTFLYDALFVFPSYTKTGPAGELFYSFNDWKHWKTVVLSVDKEFKGPDAAEGEVGLLERFVSRFRRLFQDRPDIIAVMEWTHENIRSGLVRKK